MSWSAADVAELFAVVQTGNGRRERELGPDGLSRQDETVDSLPHCVKINDPAKAGVCRCGNDGRWSIDMEKCARMEPGVALRLSLNSAFSSANECQAPKSSILLREMDDLQKGSLA